MTAQPRTVDPERAFWLAATDVSRSTSDPIRSYESLKKQWQSTCPDASPARYEAAMGRLASLLRV